MSTFTQPVYNIVVPSNYYLNKVKVTSDQQVFNLTFPNSFVPGGTNFASTIIIETELSDISSTFVLPDARLSAVGNISTMVCISEMAVDLTNFEGYPIIGLLVPGVYYLIILTDNTTSGGEWRIVELGTTPSTPDAAALAGQGLVAFNSQLNVDAITTDIAEPVTLDNTYLATFYNWVGVGVGNQDLPDGNSVTRGFFMYVRNSGDPSSNTSINFIPANSGTVDGDPSLTLNLNQSCVLIHTNGDNWKTVGLGLFAYGNGVQLSNSGIRVTNGSAAIPSYSFINAPTDGFFLNGNNEICEAIDGTQKLALGAQSLKIDSSVTLKWGNTPLLYLVGMYP